jgi:hypothetical protein
LAQIVLTISGKPSAAVANSVTQHVYTDGTPTKTSTYEKLNISAMNGIRFAVLGA